MKKLLVVCVLLVVGCSSGYGPLSGRSHGYREREVAPGRFVVEYYGDKITNQAGVRKLALYRAAELALSRGASHFKVVDTEARQLAIPGPGYGSPMSYRQNVPEGLGTDRTSANGDITIGVSAPAGAEALMTTWSSGQFHVAAVTLELSDQPGAGTYDAAKLLGQLKGRG